ncbi:MAG: c-type cytochrome [Ectothiorhodospiraceae bacterium AqS1]|nr:c-type cytochrome [Ectothiorhodospiraceae bacterium AqS1]
MHINLAVQRSRNPSFVGAFLSVIAPERLGGKSILVPLIGTALAIGSLFFAASPSLAEDSPPSYKEHIQCEDGKCKVDLWLVRGYRAFSQCQVCHGLDGTGSTIAPSLLDKMLEIDHARYVDVVTNGYQGQVGVMPAWKENPNVMKYIDQLYAYLMARADGTLPAGRLERYDR